MSKSKNELLRDAIERARTASPSERREIIGSLRSHLDHEELRKFEDGIEAMSSSEISKKKAQQEARELAAFVVSDKQKKKDIENAQAVGAMLLAHETLAVAGDPGFDEEESLDGQESFRSPFEYDPELEMERGPRPKGF